MQIVINRTNDEDFCEVRSLATLADLSDLLAEFRAPLLIERDEGEYDFAEMVQDAAINVCNGRSLLS